MIKIKILFLINGIYGIAELDKETPVPINYPPVDLSSMELASYENEIGDYQNGKLELNWEFGSSEVINDIRQVNKDYPPASSLKFVLSTSNHDGWVLFGLGQSDQAQNKDLVLFKHNCDPDEEWDAAFNNTGTSSLV